MAMTPRLRPGMQVRDYTRARTQDYGSLWEVVSVELRVDGVMDFLQESIYLLTLSNEREIRTALVPASAPGYAILRTEAHAGDKQVPLANAAAFVGYPLAVAELEALAHLAESSASIDAAGPPILLELALRADWLSGVCGTRNYRVVLLDTQDEPHVYLVPEQEAQVLTITPMEYPASQYTLTALGRA